MGGSAADQKRTTRRSLFGILIFLGRYPGLVAVCLSLLLVVISIEMILPRIIGSAITNLRWHVEWGAHFQPWTYVLLFGSLVLVRNGIAYILGPIRNRLIQSTLRDIRAATYDSLQRLAFSYHDKASSGDLISRSTGDVGRIQDFLVACMLLSVDIVISLVATLVLIFLISAPLGFVALGTVIPTVGMIIYYSGKLQPRWRKVHDLRAEMLTVIQENIAGVRVVKAFAKEADQIRKFSEKRDTFIASVLETINYWAARVPFAQFIYGLTLPIVLWIGGRYVIAGKLLIGDFATCVFYIMAMGHRMGMVGQFTSILQNASASAERILEVIEEPRSVKSGEKEFPEGNGAVVFENLSFQYQDGKPSLSEINFQAEPGKTYAIIGPTGSGKTTLVSLIPRFYDPTQGRVLIDGLDVRDLQLGELRRKISVIFQETFLFSATVAENIGFGRPGATREEVERCAQAAQAHEFIVELQHGYDTIIGERGVTLSGGQKQRIAIARAFLMDPRILILDDATSAVDSKTERAIREALARLSAGRTTFVIAHRLSTVQHADEILVLKEGRIVERGRHDQLFQQSGFYAEIFDQQIKS
jgi:ABC-type multidrug transport system fused ATPase/permease subunit